MSGTQFPESDTVGIELSVWTVTGHNGTVRGKHYFDAEQGKGLFVKRTDIAKILLPTLCVKLN